MEYPFYGIEASGGFLGFHCLAKYIRVAFFRGTSLHPVPPEASSQKELRYLHIYEAAPRDEGLLASWMALTVVLPGWIPWP